MKTKKLKCLKIGVTTIAILNVIVCIACDIATLYSAIRLHNTINCTLYLVAAIINSGAFWLMATLREAIMSELEDRMITKIKGANNHDGNCKTKNV